MYKITLKPLNKKVAKKTEIDTSTQGLRESHLKVNNQDSNSISALIKTISLSKGGENL